MKVTLHQEISDKIRRKIFSGFYDESGRLPDETSLAGQFGVSRTTISRVMLDLKTAGLIVTCPGTPARLTRFAKNATGLIGIIDPGVSCGPVLTAICNRMSSLAEKSGWKVVRETLAETEPKARAGEVMGIARSFAEQRVSGVLMQPLEFQRDNVAANRRIVECFERQGLSVVLVDFDIVSPPDRSKYDLVSIDNVSAGQRVAERLIAGGARRCGFVLPPGAPSSLVGRMHGVALAALDAGLAWNSEKNVLIAQPDDRRRVSAFVRSFRPDALVAGNDAAALRLKATLDAMKLGRMPALGSFDGQPKAVEAGVVSLRQPCGELAYVAVQTLLSRIKSPNMPIRTVTVPVET